MSKQIPKEALVSFRHNMIMENLLSPDGWNGGFNVYDKDAMVDGLKVIRTAMIQPFGATPAAKKRSSNCVTDEEVDRAYRDVVLSAMVLWLSGKLDEVEVGDE